MKNVPSNILIWNDKVGFVRINEGSGDNLTYEDEANGLVDYIMLDFFEYDGYYFYKTDGAQVMLTEMYQEQFESVTDVVDYLKMHDWIPDEEYTVVYVGG